MTIQEFENLTTSITGDDITLFLLKNQNAVKWYEKEYVKATGKIELETKYGVSINDGRMIDFDFKTGKNIDNLLRTFITQFTSKVVKYECANGVIEKLNKKQNLDRIVKRNEDRVEYGLFYTTLYGIGMFDFFNSRMIHNVLDKQMSSFLNSKNIDYKNEYSDAGWVFRYKIPTPIETTNELLTEFKEFVKSK
jgi:hypothetical protein